MTVAVAVRLTEEVPLAASFLENCLPAVCPHMTELDLTPSARDPTEAASALRAARNDVQDDTMEHLFGSFDYTELHSLALGGCQALTDRGMGWLPRTLHRLDLSGCDEVSDEAVGELFASGMRGLESLDLSCGPDVGPCLLRLEGSCRGLLKLSLNNCRRAPVLF